VTLACPFPCLVRGAILFVCGISSVCTASVPAITLEMEYAGCQAVLLPGPVCRLDPSQELRLWVGAPTDAQIEIQVEGRRIDAAGENVREGRRFSLTLPSGVKRVDVLVEAKAGQGLWSLSLAEPEDEEHRGPLVRQVRQEMSRDVLREVNETTQLVYGLIVKRQFTAARETLNGLQVPREADAKSRYLMAFYRGFLAEQEGDFRTALTEVRKAAEIAQRGKLDRYRWMAEEKLALLLHGLGRSSEAANLFDRLRQTPYFADSCEEAQFLSNQAWALLLARDAGEIFGDPKHLLEKALEIYETCERVTPEKKVNILINLALAHLLEDRLRQAKDLLARAHELEPHPPLSHMLWWLDLEARIALREERPAEALDLFDDLEDLAAATSSPDGRLRAAFGQARSHEVLGDRTAALETLRRAEALLDEQSLQIPLHQGRETFIATRQAIVDLHVELLLEQGWNAQALDVARHARSRMLRQLERRDRLASLTPELRAEWERLLMEYQQRRAALEERAKDEWKLPEDQIGREHAARRAEAEAVKKLLDQAFLVLPGERSKEEPPPHRPGELILAYHPLPHGWVGFAADGKTVRVHRFELPPDVLSRPKKEAAELLLRPFHALIRQARRIRILPSGPLQDLDFHALPFDGDVLLASSPVVYGLDLPVSTRPAQTPGRHALLVSDSRDNLPGALDETRKVREILESVSPPWIAEELKSAKASAEAVRDALSASDLLHYAGHGTFSGFGGWESSLLLAEETRLTLGDLLALDRVPAWVVLSGCETGRSSAEVPVESLGLAQAFLLAGSRAVVGSTRRADDRTLPELFPELYRQWEREPDLAVALQHAQLSWRKRNPKADWASFRLFEP